MIETHRNRFDVVTLAKKQAQAKMARELFYPEGDVSDPRIARRVAFELSWNFAESGVTFDSGYRFSKTSDLSELPEMTVRTMFITNPSVISPKERKILGLQPETMSDASFWKVYNEQIESLATSLDVQATRMQQLYEIGQQHSYEYLQRAAFGIFAKSALIDVVKVAKKSPTVSMPHVLKQTLLTLDQIGFPQLLRGEVVMRAGMQQNPFFAEDYEGVFGIVKDLIKIDGKPSNYATRRESNAFQAEDTLLSKTTLTRDDLLDAYVTIHDGTQTVAREFRWREMSARTHARRTQPIAANLVLERIDDLLKRVNTLNQNMGTEDERYAMAAKIASEFQLIHPFNNGNGRIGHMVTNFALRKLGLSTFHTPLRAYEGYQAAIDASLDYNNYSYLIALFKKFSDNKEKLKS